MRVVLLQEAHDQRNVAPQILLRAFEELALLKIAVEVVAMGVPTFEQGVLIAQQCAGFRLQVRQVARAVVMRQAVERVAATDASSCIKMARNVRVADCTST